MPSGAENDDLELVGVAALLLGDGRDLILSVDQLLDALDHGQPAVGPIHHAVEDPFGPFAAQHDARQENRGMGALGRFRETTHRRDVVVLALVGGLLLRPTRLHDLDALFRVGPAVGKVAAQDLRLFLVPARSDSEQETTVGEVIE